MKNLIPNLCRGCAACCKCRVTLTDIDIERIEAADINVNEVSQRHDVLQIRGTNEDLINVLMLNTCDDGYCVLCEAETHDCTIYKNRPQECRDFEYRGDRCRGACDGSIHTTVTSEEMSHNILKAMSLMYNKNMV